jgi:hypothetical protein
MYWGWNDDVGTVVVVVVGHPIVTLECLGGAVGIESRSSPG